MFTGRPCSSVCAASTFLSAVSSAPFDCRDMREGEEEEALCRGRVCVPSTILTSVLSFLWRAQTGEDRTACSNRRCQEGGRVVFAGG
jgi:hypothetical protein